MSVPTFFVSQNDSAITMDRTVAPLLATHWAELLAKLEQWFSVEFHLVDGSNGELVHTAFDQTSRDWTVRGQMCRAVADRGKAALIADEDPLVEMAIPLRGQDETLVAVGTFATSHRASAAQLERAATMLGMTSEEANKWIVRQTCWVPDVLLRMGQLAAERIVAEQRLQSLDREVRDLSVHLSTTYEEISLLYRLTQNLKLSSNDEALALLALEWLGEVLPVKSLAVQFLARPSGLQMTDRTQAKLLSVGECPVTCQELTEIVDFFGAMPRNRPLVVNYLPTNQPGWRWPHVSELILVPLSEGDHCFGWLAAFNHSLGGEFGSVEASLLSSVGAILGIHSGNTELYQSQRDLFAGVVRALTSAIDAKDPYTCGHSDRVARVAVRLAEELGCDRAQLETIYLSGLLHDVGKIGIDDEVLRKPGKLTEAEYEHIKTHAEVGFRILSDIKQLDEVLPVVLHHHEQWDGRGYPHGLAGNDIPLLARIVAVADSFDAMGSDRPYRQGMTDEKLDAILHEGAGSQWDAQVVEAFFRARDSIRQITQEKVNSVSFDAREVS